MPAEWQLAGLALIAVAVAATGVWVLFAHRDTPEKRERRRIAALDQRGRIAHGTITDVGTALIYYSYRIGGVDYHASQDVAHLGSQLPDDLNRLVGATALKYSPRNPANSMVVGQNWSGYKLNNQETESNDDTTEDAGGIGSGDAVRSRPAGWGKSIRAAAIGGARDHGQMEGGLD